MNSMKKFPDFSKWGKSESNTGLLTRKMHQKTKKSAFVGEALTEKGKIMQESSARESDVRFPGEESGTKAGLRCHRARHATAPLWRKAQSVIAPPERKARRANTRPA